MANIQALSLYLLLNFSSLLKPSSNSEMKSKSLLPLALLVSATFAHSQSGQIGGTQYVPVTLENFISQIDGSNVNILAKRRIVDTVTSQQSPMSTFNVNPSMSITRGSAYIPGQAPSSLTSGSFAESTTPQSTTISFSGTVEGWGKRAARSDFYAAELERNTVELESLKNAIKMDAAYSFLDALRYKLAFNSYQNAIGRLKNMKADQAADNMSRDQFNAANDLKYYSYAMTTFLSKGQVGLLEPVADINKITPRQFDLANLIDSASKNRGDVQALTKSVNSAQMSLELVRKNRNMSVTPSVWVSRTPGYSYSSSVYENQTTATGFSLSIPLPTNLLFNADLVDAANTLSNAQDYLDDLKVRVAVEVNQAYMQYGYAIDKLNAAESDYAYAQKNNTANNVDAVFNLREREGFLIDAKINHAKALVYLLKVSGQYDIPQL